MQHASHRQQTTVRNTVLSVFANMECRSPFYTVCEEEAKEVILNVVVYSSVYSKFIYVYLQQRTLWTWAVQSLRWYPPNLSEMRIRQ